MTINTKFNSPVETFCDDDSLKVFSNVVPEQEKNIDPNGFLKNESWLNWKRKRIDKVKLIT